jgi:hypothetical protein
LGGWLERGEVKALRLQLDSLKCSDSSGRVFNPRVAEPFRH